MPIALRTVANILDDVEMSWRGALLTDAGAQERTALLHALQRHARDAWTMYEWYFALKDITAVVVSANGEITPPADCESVLDVRDTSTQRSIPYKQYQTNSFGTGGAVITLIPTQYNGLTVDMTYRTVQPTFTDETPTVPTELDSFLVLVGIAEGWGLDRQMTKRDKYLVEAAAHLRHYMEVLTRQRNLKRRPVMRTYRMIGNGQNTYSSGSS